MGKVIEEEVINFDTNFVSVCKPYEGYLQSTLDSIAAQKELCGVDLTTRANIGVVADWRLPNTNKFLHDSTFAYAGVVNPLDSITVFKEPYGVDLTTRANIGAGTDWLLSNTNKLLHNNSLAYAGVVNPLDSIAVFKEPYGVGLTARANIGVGTEWLPSNTNKLLHNNSFAYAGIVNPLDSIAVFKEPYRVNLATIANVTMSDWDLSLANKSLLDNTFAHSSMGSLSLFTFDYLKAFKEPYGVIWQSETKNLKHPCFNNNFLAVKNIITKDSYDLTVICEPPKNKPQNYVKYDIINDTPKEDSFETRVKCKAKKLILQFFDYFKRNGFILPNDENELYDFCITYNESFLGLNRNNIENFEIKEHDLRLFHYYMVYKFELSDSKQALERVWYENDTRCAKQRVRDNYRLIQENHSQCDSLSKANKVQQIETGIKKQKQDSPVSAIVMAATIQILSDYSEKKLIVETKGQEQKYSKILENIKEVFGNDYSYDWKTLKNGFSCYKRLQESDKLQDEDRVEEVNEKAISLLKKYSFKGVVTKFENNMKLYRYQ